MNYESFDTAHESFFPEIASALGIRNRKTNVEINLKTEGPDTGYAATTTDDIHPNMNGTLHTSNVMAIAPMESFEPDVSPEFMVVSEVPVPEMNASILTPETSQKKMGMVATFYLGSISVVGLYIFYRILMKNK
jgi:hypothetical protein